MHIIVTGGCGYKGSILTSRLLALGHKVTIIDLLWFGNNLTSNENLTVLQQDIRYLKSLPQADAIIHLAAVANDPCCELDSKLSWEINVLGTHNLLQLCCDYGIQRFIYASSGSVYGISNELVVHEDTALLPISDYNKTKMIAERVISSYMGCVNVTILRPATVCGVSPRQRFDVAVNALTISAIRNGKIVVNGGDQVRPNVHIFDMIEAYVWCLDNPSTYGEIFNVGFENLTLTEIAERVSAIIPANIDYSSSNDPRSYRLSSQKLLSLGFKPKYTIDNAIKEIMQADPTPQDINYNMKWMKKCNIK